MVVYRFDTKGEAYAAAKLHPGKPYEYWSSQDQEWRRVTFHEGTKIEGIPGIVEDVQKPGYWYDAIEGRGGVRVYEDSINS